ncbi:hypothetical protein M9H77_03939 [Catharanthus roseus]|uniref:Uncharacterized protein n=1 Tax=Catharanthus roseus TaxID=4058 RepID=A0ACC0CCR3_CATRO|nr:hypothetical protein M9H77_03939 [Catharanthus roseus]
MEFQVKFILYVTANFLCSTIKYAYKYCWVPILCDAEKLGQLNWSKYVADFLENKIKLRVGDRASVLYMERFSPVREKVSPYQNRRTPRIVDWSNAAINKRVRKLRELGLFSRVDVIYGRCSQAQKDAVELEALRSRLDSFWADVIEVKSELKSLRESMKQLGRNVELSQSKMMEELHRFMSLINEKCREGGDIDMDYDSKKKTRSEILHTKTQEGSSKMLNRHTITKLVTPMSVPARLAEYLDFPVVAEDVAMHDADEDTISDGQINEGNDMAGYNQICAQRIVNDEEAAQCV